MTVNYLVVENTPGYLPESDPLQFDSYSEALNYLVKYNADLYEDGLNPEAIVNGLFNYENRVVEIVAVNEYDPQDAD